MASAPEGVFIVYKDALLCGALPTLTFADRYDQHAIGFDEMTDRTLKRAGQVVALSRENYSKAIAHRPHGTVGAGFTPSELVSWGIIDTLSEHDEFPLGFEAYKGYFIVMRRSGPVPNFEILSEKRERMRERNCKTVETARAFIDDLPAVEPADDVHVRSESFEPA